MLLHPFRPLVTSVLLLVTSLASHAQPAPPAGLVVELHEIQAEWATLRYETPAGDARLEGLHKLAARSAALSRRYPERAEPLIWEGIVLSTAAGESGGLGALGLARKARDRLEAALAIDEGALSGSAHTSLGALYHKVPGFPLGFGSDRKARAHFEAALAYDPEGIDANYFYAEYLADKGELGEAAGRLEAALRAPSRPGRDTADRGRRAESSALLAEVRRKLGGDARASAVDRESRTGR